MECPSVLFPIFPPLRYWHPASGDDLPSNRFVLEKLEAVAPQANAFASTRCCFEYLRWRGQGRPFDYMTYSQVTRNLEAMLHWSFMKRVSLLEWTPTDAHDFMVFCARPPAVWNSSAVHLRFIPQEDVPFTQWPLNERWRLFCRRLDAHGKALPPVQRTYSVLLIEAKRFFAFNGARRGLNEFNPFKDVENGKRLGLPAFWDTPAVLSFRQMDWAFEFAANCAEPYVRASETALFLAFARYTSFPVNQIVGSDHNPALLSQFSRRLDGNWKYSLAGGGDASDWCDLPGGFSAPFERHLKQLGIVATDELPAFPLFPQLNPAYGYSVDALRQHLERFRTFLFRAAERDADKEISSASSNFSLLSFSMVRRSAARHASD